ncbi:MAG TPA: hypothetical protein VLK66_24805 [Longimicrobium sp.]|nr:hypothetical protein [Longimicrobium sp.]
MNRSAAAAALILPLLVAACAGDDTPVTPPAPPSAPAGAVNPDLPGTDGEFMRLARQIPGFGGYWLDHDGSVNVALTDAAQEAKARAVLAPVTRLRRDDRGGEGAASFRFHRVEYDFGQLATWHARLTSVLTLPGVVFTDADETANRIRIGISNPSARGAVEAEVARLKVPLAAVIVEHAAAVEPTVALSSYIRPVIGGVGITRDIGGTCTLGFNAYYVNPYWGAGVGTRVFFTADHCTATQGHVDGTVFSQGGSRIGVELADPPMLTSATYLSCPAGWQCRFSDVAAVRYDDAVAWTLGGIAHTAYWFGQTSGSTDADLANTFHINGGGSPVVGMVVGKVGVTTGWTAGPVQKTCSNFSGAGGILILCQDFVDAYANSGDSGSPVFTSSGSGASLYGIVWAKTSRYDPDTGTTLNQFVFSNTNNIQRDFGSFTPS